MSNQELVTRLTEALEAEAKKGKRIRFTVTRFHQNMIDMGQDREAEVIGNLIQLLKNNGLIE
jgi:hypothetical protein